MPKSDRTVIDPEILRECREYLPNTSIKYIMDTLLSEFVAVLREKEMNVSNFTKEAASNAFHKLDLK